MSMDRVRSDSNGSSTEPLQNPVMKTGPTNWTKIILNILPTIIFGVFTVVFTIQQNDFFRTTRNQDLVVADAQNKRVIFDNYIDVISDRLLSSEFRRNNSEHLLIIRAKTLTALRHLDAHYKSEIVFFLYENKLVRADVPEAERLDLDGADLNSARFVRSPARRCFLPNLYLPGVFAADIVFDGCRLMNSVFSGGVLNGSRFISCSLGQTRFIDTWLHRASFIESDLDGVSFQGGILIDAKFIDTFVQNLTLKNTDMLGSDMNSTDITIVDVRKPNIISNTRFPNGSFSSIDSKQLVTDGGAERECSSSNHETSWGKIRLQERWQWHKKVNNAIDNSALFLPDPINGNCYFISNASTLVYQQILVPSYSVLIKSGQACCNISAYVGCSKAHPDDKVTITVRFIDTLNLSDVEESIVMTGQAKPFEFITKVGPIPKDTYMISVRPGTQMNASVISSVPRYCAIDDIKMFIVNHKNKKEYCGI